MMIQYGRTRLRLDDLLVILGVYYGMACNLSSVLCCTQTAVPEVMT